MGRMPADTPRPLPVALSGLALIGALVLAGCASPGDQPGDGTPSPTVSGSATAGPSPSGSPTPVTPSATAAPATPVDLACTDVLSLQAVYDFNPNYGADPGYSPTAGSDAAEAVARDGIACGWLNQTSGDTFEVAVSIPSDDELERLRAAARAAGSEFEVDGADAWFAASGGVGIAWLRVDDHWVVIGGAQFGGPGDVAQLAQAAADAIGD